MSDIVKNANWPHPEPVEDNTKYCACCGNLSGCDCFGSGLQRRRIKDLEAREITAVDTLAREIRRRYEAEKYANCPDCDHPWSDHEDEDGCQIEQGDILVGDNLQAGGPCGCKQQHIPFYCARELLAASILIATVRTALEPFLNSPAGTIPMDWQECIKAALDALDTGEVKS